MEIKGLQKLCLLSPAQFEVCFVKNESHENIAMTSMSAAILRLAVCIKGHHEQSQHEWQKCQVHHEPTFFWSSLLNCMHGYSLHVYTCYCVKVWFSVCCLRASVFLWCFRSLLLMNTKQRMPKRMPTSLCPPLTSLLVSRLWFCWMVFVSLLTSLLGVSSLFLCSKTTVPASSSLSLLPVCLCLITFFLLMHAHTLPTSHSFPPPPPTTAFPSYLSVCALCPFSFWCMHATVPPHHHSYLHCLSLLPVGLHLMSLFLLVLVHTFPTSPPPHCLSLLPVDLCLLSLWCMRTPFPPHIDRPTPTAFPSCLLVCASRPFSC